MSNRRFLTRSGTIVTPETGVPSLRDIAIALFRICRYAGQCDPFWTVGHHSLLVAEQVDERERIYALLHDAEESITGDITRIAKNKENVALGDALRGRIFDSLRIPHPTTAQWEEVKRADNDATLAELHTLLRGARQLKTAEELLMEAHSTAKPSPRACQRLQYWLHQWTSSDCVSGDRPAEFFLDECWRAVGKLRL